MKRLTLTISLILVVIIGVQAGDLTLSNNSGTDSAPFFISGEPTLVINGFDLAGRGIPTPTQIDRISINVETPVPDQPVTAVIYQDANGGSPIDATLVQQTQVNITQAGVFTLDLTANPVEITQPVVWIGFYLPVDFVFQADTSGSSVLTYWAWTPGGTFDLADLAAAEVLGPGDGSAPVNINMGGVARITAELLTDGAVVPTATPDSNQIVPGTGRVNRNQEIFDTIIPPVVTDAQGNIAQANGGNADLSFVLEYPDDRFEDCNGLYYDSYDVKVTYRDFVDFFCKSVGTDFSPSNPLGYTRQGSLYDVYAFNIDQGLNPWPEPVTHCILTPPNALNRAVIGFAQGSPRTWEILPSVQYGDVVCADIPGSGFVSYFLPG